MYDNDGQAVIYTDIRNPDYDRNCMQYTNPFELVQRTSVLLGSAMTQLLCGLQNDTKANGEGYHVRIDSFCFFCLYR